MKRELLWISYVQILPERKIYILYKAFIFRSLIHKLNTYREREHLFLIFILMGIPLVFHRKMWYKHVSCNTYSLLCWGHFLTFLIFRVSTRLKLYWMLLQYLLRSSYAFPCMNSYSTWYLVDFHSWDKSNLFMSHYSFIVQLNPNSWEIWTFIPDTNMLS